MAAQTVSVTSSGVVTGDNPINHALLLLIVQIALIIALSRFLSLVLRPLRQPRVVAEILGGILLGPTAFGNIPGFTAKIFPTSSLVVLDTFANFGLIFFLFLVGLELDLRSLSKTGKAALWMAVSGIVVPFGLGVVVSFIIFKVMKNELHTGFGAFTVFIGVALSITAFPVLARILAERKLLTTELGRIAMSAAAVNDVVAWILLALAVAITNAGSSPIVALWVLLLGIAFLLFMFLLVRPIAFALTHYEDPIPETVVAVTMVLVLGAAFLTDIIGIHVIFGAFICGLIIPKDGPFAGMLIEKIEDYVSILFLPLYFASSGLKTHLSAVNNGTAGLATYHKEGSQPAKRILPAFGPLFFSLQQVLVPDLVKVVTLRRSHSSKQYTVYLVGILALVLGTACLGKVMGTVVVAKLFGMDVRRSFALGFLMNTKGLVELIVLNIGLSKGVINDELFAIMVIMAIVTTFMTTPLVMWLHPPARNESPYRRRNLEAGNDSDELRLLIGAHGPRNLSAMVHLTEMLRGKWPKSLRVFVLHLMEFSERSSAIRIASMAREGGRPHWREAESELNSVEVTFQTYGQLSKVKVKTTIAISAYNNMHEDICATAAINRANFIVLPFHRYYRHDGSFEAAFSGFHHVNSLVLQHSPCSVGILVDRGFGGPSVLPVNISQHICVLFFGGPDDREALMLARRMSQHHGVRLSVIQCLVRFTEPHARDGIQRVTSDALLAHLPVKYAAKEVLGRALARAGHCVSNFFKAPYRTNKPVQEEVNPEAQGHNHARSMDTSGLSRESHLPDTVEKQRGSVHLKMDKVEYENEKKMDMQALAPLLAAVKNSSMRETKRTESNNFVEFTPSGANEDAAAPHYTSRNLTLQVWEMDDPHKSILEVAQSLDYGLLIVGLHAHSRSPISRTSAFPLSSAHGLGPVGSLLVSRECRDMRSSVLVVQQHHPSQGHIELVGLPDEALETAPAQEESAAQEELDLQRESHNSDE